MEISQHKKNIFLYKACQANNPGGVSNWLKQGSDMNWPNPQELDRTCLHIASALGSFQCVDLLCRKGVGLHTKRTGGITALHEAASEGHLEVVRLLMRFGMDPHIKDDRGKTAADIARDNNKESCVHALEAYMRERPEQYRISARKKGPVLEQTVSKVGTNLSDILINENIDNSPRNDVQSPDLIINNFDVEGMQFKIQRLEQENETLKNTINKLKIKMDNFKAEIRDEMIQAHRLWRVQTEDRIKYLENNMVLVENAEDIEKEEDVDPLLVLLTFHDLTKYYEKLNGQLENGLAELLSKREAALVRLFIKIGMDDDDQDTLLAAVDEAKKANKVEI